jgi:polyhydroxyalkanoate synthase
MGKRLGPRPLPGHLATALWTWTSSYAALPLWKSGWLPSSPELAETADRLRGDLENVSPEAFSAALAEVATRRHRDLLAGIQAYRHHPYRRDVTDPPAIWREGSTCLRDYGAVEGARSGGPVVLCVPSLINRAYVLDLKADNSLLRTLAADGVRPLLVDWGWPGPAEKSFAFTDYIAGRLEGALDAACEVAGGPVAVLGYCMGGMLALALAQRRRRDVGALALLATPWDFHAEQGAQARLAARGGELMEPAMQAMGQLPVDAIQMLFAGLDPHTAVRKFLTFGRLDQDSRRAEVFVALEDWLNDGVPLAAPVARECLYEWYGANTPARGGWQIAGRPVDPAHADMPALCLVPQHDRIVPPASAAALGRALPCAEVRIPPLGHIGMVVSGRAREEVWSPLLTWLKARMLRRK